MKPILLTPNPILSQEAQPVKKINKNIKKIIKEMQETLLSASDPKGVGLAAPQIGYPLQIFAMKPSSKARITFYFNPKIISESEDLIEIPPKNTPLEGCLSIPNTWGVVRRKKWVVLSYLNTKGQRKTKTFKGFPAIIVQHEMDHLKGVMFTQRVLEQKGRLYEIIKDKEGKEKLKELPL